MYRTTPGAPVGLRVAVSDRGEISIRRGRPDDAEDVARLAALAGDDVPAGELLLGEADGQLLAALPLAGGGGLRDPFVPAADVLDLLEHRRSQLRSRRRLLPRR